MDTPFGERSGVLELRVEGDKLTGSLSHGEHRVAISDGRASGDRLSWTAVITAPIKASVRFAATLEGDVLRGEAKHFLGRAPFAATRLV